MTERALPIPATCPNCKSADIHAHSKSSWCGHCGWAQNRFKDPATGRHTTHPGMESRRRGE